MKHLLAIFALLSSYAFAAQATPPSITLAPGTYSGAQQIGPITDANSGTKITCGTIDGTTPVTNGAGTACTAGFALNDPSYYTVGATETVKLVSGTSTLTDSTVTSNAYTINNANTISADAFGYQCQSNSLNCASFTFPLVAGAPPHFRVWDCASPFYSTVTAGTNCNWASIESVTAGTYVWTALDSWMDAIDAYRAIHPGFIAAYTFGMIPCTRATIPGGFTVTGVTATTGSGASGTITYSGSFGATTLLGVYVSITGMNNSSNNVSGVAVITTWSTSSITITGQAGVVDLSANTGTLNGVPGPKGCGIVPSDLPLSAGSPWNGTPPSPGPSPSFNAFVTALVNHCSAGHPTHCFYNEFNVVEGWNEPNNNIFCNPGFCSIPQVYQMLAGAIPVIRAKMTGAGGTNLVSIQTIASTASAAATNTVLSLETANGILSDTLAFHQYLSATGNAPPETNVANMTSIIGKRALNAGWANTPWRMTESSWESNSNPYGCAQGSPWTLNDCIGQMVRWQLLTQSNGAAGLDWYNWDVNIGKVPAYQSAYAYQQQYLTGGTLSACTNAGSPAVYQCPFTEANGTTALWVWVYCPTGGTYAACSSSGTSFTIPAGYTQFRDLTGSLTPVVAGNSLTVTVQPVMLEQLTIPAAPAPQIL